jgi:hypothetical protein
MPLNSGLLETDLRNVFEGSPAHPSSASAAGAEWARAYAGYAAGAIAGTALPLTPALVAAEQTLAGKLGTAFGGSQPAASVAASIDAAVVSFWLAPPVVFQLLPSITGVVTLAVPGVLTGSLTAAFLEGQQSARSAGEQARVVARALDLWTRTVQVTNTVTPPGAVQPPVPLL